MTSAWRWFAKQPGGIIGQSRVHPTLSNIQDLCQAAPGGRNDQSSAVSNPCESWQSYTLFDPKPKPSRSPANRRIKKYKNNQSAINLYCNMIYGNGCFLHLSLQCCSQTTWYSTIRQVLPKIWFRWRDLPNWSRACFMEASWRPNIFYHTLMLLAECQQNKPCISMHCRSIHKQESQHIGSPWPNMNRR